MNLCFGGKCRIEWEGLGGTCCGSATPGNGLFQTSLASPPISPIDRLPLIAAKLKPVRNTRYLFLCPDPFATVPSPTQRGPFSGTELGSFFWGEMLEGALGTKTRGHESSIERGYAIAQQVNALPGGELISKCKTK